MLTFTKIGNSKQELQTLPTETTKMIF